MLGRNETWVKLTASPASDPLTLVLLLTVGAPRVPARSQAPLSVAGVGCPSRHVQRACARLSAAPECSSGFSACIVLWAISPLSQHARQQWGARIRFGSDPDLEHSAASILSEQRTNPFWGIGVSAGFVVTSKLVDFT